MRAKGQAWTQSLFPPLCVICHKTFSKAGDVADICPRCLSGLPWRRRSEAILPLLSNRLRYEISQDEWERASAVKVLVPLLYDGEIPHLIRRLKFHGRLEVARPLANLMTTAVRLYPLESFDAVAAVPLHPLRMRERGYNQAGELSKIIAEDLGLAELSFAMDRVVHTKRQSELAYALRTDNLKNAFKADPRILAKRHVLLVDDILTSGATLWSAVQAVQTAGAASVTGLVVASGRKIEVN